MKKFTYFILTGLMLAGFVKTGMAQDKISGDALPQFKNAAFTQSVQSVKNVQQKGILLDSLSLLKTRWSMGITVVHDTIVITSSDGKGNNYFDIYDFTGKYIKSVKQQTTSNWGYRDLAFDGKYILASDNQYIRKVSPVTFTVVSSILNKDNTIHRGLAYDPNQNVIYSTNWGGPLLKIDATTGKTIKNYGKVAVYQSPFGIAFDPYSVSGMASLWYSTPSYFKYFMLARVDTTAGKINFIYDFSNQLIDSCLVGGLEIVNNLTKYPDKTVALMVDQYGRKLYFADISHTPLNMPVSMTQVGSYDGSSDSEINITTGFVVYEKYLYAIRNKKLAIYQVDTDPAHPKLLRTIDLDSPNKIFLYKKALFISGGGESEDNTTKLMIFSLDDPLNPVLKSTIKTGGHVLGMTFVGKYAYMVQRGDVNVRSLDISDLSKPFFSQIFALPYSGLAIGSDTTARLLFVSFDGSGWRGFYVLSVADMPATIKRIYDYWSGVYAYVSFVTINGKTLAALGNDYHSKVSYIGFWHYTPTSCTQELEDYFSVCDTTTASQMGLISGSTILVAVPGQHLLKTYSYDDQLRYSFDGPVIHQESPTAFVWYTPEGTKSNPVPSIENTNDFNKATYVYATNGMKANGVNYGSEKIGVIKLESPVATNKVKLTMHMNPSQAGFDGCTIEPTPGTHQYKLSNPPATISLKAHAKPDKGWYFAIWTGDASGSSETTSVKMDKDKDVTANFINLTLYIHGAQKKRVICPDSVKKYALKMLPFQLTVSDGDEWVVSAVRVRAKGSGNEKTDVKKVMVYQGSNKLGEAVFPSDNGKVTIGLNPPLSILPGNSLDLNLRYLFNGDNLAQKDTVVSFLVSVLNVTAKPKHYEEGLILGMANADTLEIARVINKTKNRGFSKIQNAINASVTKDGDTLLVCPGNYQENLKITKDLAIISKKGPEQTIISGLMHGLEYDPIISVKMGRVTIKGFRIEKSTLSGMIKKVDGIYAWNDLNKNDETNVLQIINNSFSNVDCSIHFYCYDDNTNVDITSNHFENNNHLLLFHNEYPHLSILRMINNDIDIPDDSGLIKLAGRKAVIFVGNHLFSTEKYFDIAISGVDSVVVDNNSSLIMSSFHINYVNTLFFRNNYQLTPWLWGISSTHSCIKNNRKMFFMDITNSAGMKIDGNTLVELQISVKQENKIGIKKGIFEITNNEFDTGSLSIKNTHYDIIKNNVFTNNKGLLTIELIQVEGEKIQGNKIINSGGEGIFMQDAHKCVISHNRIIHNRNGGICIKDGQDNIIKFNRIVDNTSYGIRMVNGKNNGIMFNWLKRNRIGVLAKNMSDSHIHNNIVEHNCTGIRLINSSRIKLWENYISNSFCLFTGIHIENSNPEIIGNLINGNNGFGIVTTRNANPVLHRNNILSNKSGGLMNKSAGLKVDARNNWWGSADGPLETDVLGNVDASEWQTAASGTESVVESHNIYALVGKNDSAYVFYNNLQGAKVSMDFAFADKKGWLQMPATVSMSASDSMGIALPVKYKIPDGVKEGVVDTVVVKATPKTKENVSFLDTLLIYVYVPKLQQISVSPDSLTIVKTDTLLFTATGYDQHNHEFKFHPMWQASMGKIDSTGTFISGSETGVVTITSSDKNKTVKGMTCIYVAEQPPVLKRIRILPDTLTLKVGETFMFDAKGYNQYDFPANIGLEWKATGGTIDQDGYYIADSVSGTFTVTARDTVTGVLQQAVVIIENTTGLESQHNVLKETKLFQNYPNPFSRSTQIRYELTKPAYVVLSVYDLQGRKVACPVNGRKQAGRYIVRFDAAGLPSGTYFYRLQTDGFAIIKKMLIMK